jgi:energy-coupling factor transporter transmembrane protein EcfT
MNRIGLLLYRPQASPLHATRAGVAALWGLALIAASLLLYHPVALAVLALAVLAAGWGAGVARALAPALRTGLIVGLLYTVVNVIVSREGLTVFARLGDLGPFGQGDLTVEALVYGGVIALKVTVLILITALCSLCIDPDALLRICRRLSYRSALTASLAVRMIPVLAADAQRIAEAQRTRPDGHTDRRWTEAGRHSPLTEAGGHSPPASIPRSASTPVSASGRITFAEWDRSVVLIAPANAVDIEQLQHSQ